MLVSKTFVVFIFLCLVHNCISKPVTENELEGRGVMTSIWGWITYPFSWWSPGETEKPVTEQLLGSSTDNINNSVDIRSHNVTIWCNDQTCHTMKCDKTQCRNMTCNIYDTDFRGECREYNTLAISDEPHMPKTTETTPEVTSLANNTQEKDNNTVVEDHALELEAVLSSTVTS